MKKVTNINSGSIWVVKCLELFTSSSCFSVISRDFLDVCVLICNGEKKTILKKAKGICNMYESHKQNVELNKPYTVDHLVPFT